ncbi:MerR family transcriptional regulator [Actinopolymorpha pittospori]|uniref:Excisionase family DNA binding protein n=1 Tax=Actinopolymorpha pittospori TaxID=648752 RepID=A0A927MQ74_9ACTN|nr:excisionase family DNA binding protein [Actinopolymorpha pittospori]
MTENTADRALAIGEVARLTGVPVRTIRFYCEEGVLEYRRSTGGHRKFDPAAVERLSLLRRLRGLGLSLPAVTDVLTGRRSVADAVAAERALVDVELAALSWRRASLRAVEDANPAERSAHLDLLAVVQDGHAVYEALMTWHRHLVGPLPREMGEALAAVIVPAPPADPTPAQVVAYAEMASLISDRSLARQIRTAPLNKDLVAEERAALLVRVREACDLAAPLLLAGRQPRLGRAVDHFVEAYADARRVPDSPVFRRDLVIGSAAFRQPRVRRYWDLVTEVSGDRAPIGAAHAWLLDALEGAVGSSPSGLRRSVGSV